MTDELSGLRIAFLVANEGVEQEELTTPWRAVQDHGGTPVLLAPRRGAVQAMDHLDRGDTFHADYEVVDVSADEFAAVILPGGVANPDHLRLDQGALAFLRAMFAAHKPAAVICHGPWTLIDAGLVTGRTLTSWPSIKTDLRNAGANWVDAEVHICAEGPNVLVTSRRPDDLPAFCRAFVNVFGSVAGEPPALDPLDEAGKESFPASDPPAFSDATMS